MQKIQTANVPLWGFGDAFKPETTAASDRCGEPSLWTMMDEATPEVEVLKALHALAVMTKPEIVVTHGDRTGYASLYLAQALRENGFGQVVIVGLNDAEREKAGATCLSSGLDRWVQFAAGIGEDVLIGMAFVVGDEDAAKPYVQQAEPWGFVLLHGDAQVLEAKAVSKAQFATPRGLTLLQRNS